jgi:hypothetical protein
LHITRLRGQRRSPPRRPVRPALGTLPQALPQLAWDHLKAIGLAILGGCYYDLCTGPSCSS